jgi:DNA-binding NtrC family response regulator
VGDEAVAQIYLLRGQVHLVVSDVAMPGLSGDALAVTISERWPGLPVLLISAAPPPPTAETSPFLQKPSTPEALVEAVERLLPIPNRERAFLLVPVLTQISN